MAISKSFKSIFASLLLGAVIGGGLVHIYDRRQVRRNYLGSTCMQSQRLMHRIDFLDQKSFQELNNEMQNDLDIGIRIIGLFALKQNEEGQIARRQLKRISEYRKLHPFTSSVPEVSKSVDSALALGN